MMANNFAARLSSPPSFAIVAAEAHLWPSCEAIWPHGVIEAASQPCSLYVRIEAALKGTFIT